VEVAVVRTPFREAPQPVPKTASDIQDPVIVQLPNSATPEQMEEESLFTLESKQITRIEPLFRLARPSQGYFGYRSRQIGIWFGALHFALTRVSSLDIPGRTIRAGIACAR